MNKRIAATFAKLAAAGHPGLVAYVTAGDPDYGRSLQVVDRIIAAGAAMVELGVPFSDPLADGEANQLAAERALRSGMTPWKVLELAADIRSRHPDTPLVLFTYLNPVAYSSGAFGRYCRKAVEAGVDAILPLDLPPGEDEDLRRTIIDSGLDMVSLVAPTSAPGRLPSLVEHATGFVYYVCREGVTGERSEFASGVGEKLAALRSLTSLPIVVGFGISSPEHVAAAARCGADGVVVGSAIVRMVEKWDAGQVGLDDIGAFVGKLAAATKDDKP